MNKTFKVESFDHEIGNANCDECWTGYPKQCQCGGLVHAEFGDYIDCENAYLVYSCDKCGDNYDEVE